MLLPLESCRCQSGPRSESVPPTESLIIYGVPSVCMYVFCGTPLDHHCTAVYKPLEQAGERSSLEPKTHMDPSTRMDFPTTIQSSCRHFTGVPLIREHLESPRLWYRWQFPMGPSQLLASSSYATIRLWNTTSQVLYAIH